MTDDIVLLAGSTQEPEEAMALDTFAIEPAMAAAAAGDVPRHPDRFEAVAKLLEPSAFRGSGGRSWDGEADGEWPVG